MEALQKFFSKSNLDAVEALVNESLSVRDLARRIKCSPAKITQFIRVFRKNSLVKLKNEKNKKIISLQRDNPLLKEIVRVIFLRKILASKIFSELKNNAKSIGLYGSITEGNIDSKSDIDLWVLSENKKPMLEGGKIRMEASRQLGREANIRFLTPADVKKLKKEDTIFYNEIEYKSIILFGEGLGE